MIQFKYTFTKRGIMKTAKSMIIELNNGHEVSVNFFPEIAPNHVERVATLSEEGFYDNCPFHRVIEGFMAQTGDGINQDGTGGSSYPNLEHEFSQTPHKRGTLSMARAMDPNSANSQFFICFGDTPHLDGQYTVFGEVIKGMEHIDNIKRGHPGSGIVSNPDRIKTIRIERK